MLHIKTCDTKFVSKKSQRNTLKFIHWFLLRYAICVVRILPYSPKSYTLILKNSYPADSLIILGLYFL